MKFPNPYPHYPRNPRKCPQRIVMRILRITRTDRCANPSRLVRLCPAGKSEQANQRSKKENRRHGR